MEQHLRDILAAALAAADPAAAVRQALHVDDGAIVVGARARAKSAALPGQCTDPAVGAEAVAARRVVVAAVGKAAVAMASAAEETLGALVSGGLVVTKDGYEGASRGHGLRRLEVVTAGHPVPNAGSIAAAERIAALAAGLGEDDLLLALISGGASALLADPAGDITLRDLAELSEALLRSGAAIEEMNAVRKHLSTLKGGGLARLAWPARVASLLLSDVVGDDPSTIGSGPTAPDPSTLDDVADILRRYGIAPPARVARYLATAPETPKPGDALFARATNLVVGGGRRSAEAAADRARELGYAPLILSTLFTGPARGLARAHAAIVREVLEAGHPLPAPCALISGGEATVVVRGEGRGGPNQEFALALALELEGAGGWAALAVDTDGTDGPTDAAGGLVTPETATAIRAAGVDPSAALAANDAYPALRAGKALLAPGPTGTNVNDLRVILVQ